MNERTVKLLKDLDGWGGLDLDNEAFDKLKEEQEKEGRSLASIFHQAFVQNDAGKIVLDLMIKQYLAKTIPDGKVTKAGRQAGKADLIREILLNIELAESE